jgi:hypothetical protein
MLNGLLILIMIGHNTARFVIRFLKLEMKKLHDWVASVCTVSNRMFESFISWSHLY